MRFVASRITHKYTKFKYTLMNTLSVTYKYKYCIDFAPNYVFTICGLCVNLKTNRLIKKVKVGGSIGYVIASKFYSLKYLRQHLVIKRKEKLPF